MIVRLFLFIYYLSVSLAYLTFPCDRINTMQPAVLKPEGNWLPPFWIQIWNHCYEHMAPVRVTLQGYWFSTGQKRIVDFVLQARSGCLNRKDDNIRFGEFMAEGYQCPNDFSSVTKTDHVPLTQIDVLWTPLDNYGDVVFVASIESESFFQTTWTKIRSRPLPACQPDPLVNCPPLEWPEICSLPLDVGLYCYEPSTHEAIAWNTFQEKRLFFYYNRGACRQMRYRGCAGNSNRFISERDCIKRCSRPHKNWTVRSAHNITPSPAWSCNDTGKDKWIIGDGRCLPTGTECGFSDRSHCLRALKSSYESNECYRLSSQRNQLGDDACDSLVKKELSNRSCDPTSSFEDQRLNECTKSCCKLFWMKTI